VGAVENAHHDAVDRDGGESTWARCGGRPPMIFFHGGVVIDGMNLNTDHIVLSPASIMAVPPGTASTSRPDDFEARMIRSNVSRGAQGGSPGEPGRAAQAPPAVEFAQREADIDCGRECRLFRPVAAMADVHCGVPGIRRSKLAACRPDGAGRFARVEDACSHPAHGGAIHAG